MSLISFNSSGRQLLFAPLKPGNAFPKSTAAGLPKPLAAFMFHASKGEDVVMRVKSETLGRPQDTYRPLTKCRDDRQNAEHAAQEHGAEEPPPPPLYWPRIFPSL